MDPLCCLHLYVQGHVQGVGFRASARHHAEHLELKGWVRNCRDGRVEIAAWGPASQLDALHRWLQHGPSGARVLALEPAGGSLAEPQAPGFAVLATR